MALITCPKCGSQISDKATQCPKCGCPVENALQNAEKEQESEKKQHVSEIVEEQERIISHLEKSAEEETKSVVEKQKEIISKLEEEKANDFKSKRTNLGKYLFYGILFCILLIGGYFLLNSNEKKEFDSNAGLQEPTAILNEEATIDNIRDEKMEMEAMKNHVTIYKAITTTGLVYETKLNEDFIRIFIKVTEWDEYYYKSFIAYFYKINNPKEIYRCKLSRVWYEEGDIVPDFIVYDSKNQYFGEFQISVQSFDYEYDLLSYEPFTFFKTNKEEINTKSKRILI